MTAHAPRFRVVTANLFNGRARPEAFGQLIEAIEPDVVAVQELSPQQADFLGRTLPFGTLRPARDHTGMGVLLRHPARVGRFPLSWCDGLLAEVALDAPGRDDDVVEIINVHVIAPQVPPVWRTLARRRAQVRRIAQHLRAVPRRRRLVVGDFNATPAWPVYRRLVGLVTDAAVEAAAGNGHRPRATWGPWPGSPRLLRIDHVLVRGFKVHRVEVVPVIGSDHSAVVADLSALEPHGHLAGER